jgi:hypothetical protein
LVCLAPSNDGWSPPSASSPEGRTSLLDADVERGDLEVLAVVARQGGRCVQEFFWAQRLDQLATGDTSFERHGVRTTRAARPSSSSSSSSSP